MQGPNYFSSGFDAIKLVKGVWFLEQNQDIFGGTYPDNVVPVPELRVEKVENKPTDLKLEKNDAELAFEIKIIVLTLQRVQEGMPPYILIYGIPQTNNERNNFIKVSQDACTNSCESLEDMRFLKSSVDGVPCESIMIHKELLNYMSGDVFYVGLIDTNQNVKNNRYQMIGGSCASILGGYVYGIGLLQ